MKTRIIVCALLILSQTNFAAQPPHSTPKKSSIVCKLLYATAFVVGFFYSHKYTPETIQFSAVQNGHIDGGLEQWKALNAHYQKERGKEDLCVEQLIHRQNTLRNSKVSLTRNK